MRDEEDNDGDDNIFVPRQRIEEEQEQEQQQEEENINNQGQIDDLLEAMGDAEENAVEEITEQNMQPSAIIEENVNTNSDNNTPYVFDTSRYTEDQQAAMSTMAILDSGADHTTIPISLARRLPWDVDQYQIRQQRIILEYGNGQTLTSVQQIQIGDYIIHVMPDEANQALVSLGEIVDQQHAIILLPTRAVIQHLTGVYTLTFPREIIQEDQIGRTASWMVPISVQQQLTELRTRWARQIDWLEALSASEAQANEDEVRRNARLETYSRWRDEQNMRDHNSSAQFWNPMNINWRQAQETDDEDDEDVDEYLRQQNVVTVHEDENAAADEDGDGETEEVRSRAYSARLHNTPRTDVQRVTNLHERMGHAPEDVMCLAVHGSNPEWSNTGVTEEMIQTVFRKEP